MHDVMTRSHRRSVVRSPGQSELPRRQAGLLRLQQLAGNRAVSSLLAVQRCGSVAPEACPCHEKQDEQGGSTDPVAQRDAESAGSDAGTQDVPGSDGCTASSSNASGERVRFVRFSNNFLDAAEERHVRDLAHTLGPGERFVIHGFASYENRPDHATLNWRLSCARAERVRDILRSEGVRDDQIAALQAHGADPAVHADLASQRSVVIDKQQSESPTPTPTPEEHPEAEKRVCGPDIDSQLTAVLNDIETYYRGLNPVAKYISCNAITFPMTAAMAWDILELFLPNTGWLRSPPFAGRCGVPGGGTDVESPTSCSNTVRVGGKCNLAGTVNYATLGMIARMCGPYTPRALGHANITALVYAWKSIEASVTGKWDDPTPAIAFAIAVYDGGASARPSTENRPTCTESCAETAVPTFSFRWQPFHG